MHPPTNWGGYLSCFHSTISTVGGDDQPRLLCDCAMTPGVQGRGHCLCACMVAVQERMASMRDFTASSMKHIEAAHMVELLQIPKVSAAMADGDSGCCNFKAT